jgi:hypothetical protein
MHNPNEVTITRTEYFRLKMRNTRLDQREVIAAVARCIENHCRLEPGTVETVYEHMAYVSPATNYLEELIFNFSHWHNLYQEYQKQLYTEEVANGLLQKETNI